MTTSSKIKTLLIIFFIVIFSIIAARHFIGLHFEKKFSIRPAPGVIVSTVERSLFYKSIETFGTGKISDKKIVELVRNHFELRPKGLIAMLDLLRPIYRQTAAYGHFGREEADFSWERTDKADALRSDAAL